MISQNMYSTISVLVSEIASHKYLQQVQSLVHVIQQRTSVLTNPISRPQNDAAIDNAALQVRSTLEVIRLNTYKRLGTKETKEVKTNKIIGEDISRALSYIKNNIDTDYEATRIFFNNYLNQLSSFIDFSNQYKSFIDTSNWGNDIEDNLLILTFENAADINTMRQLASASNDWTFIVNAFSRVTGDHDTEIRIISIERGSLIETVSLGIGIIGGILFAAVQISELVLNLYEIRKQALSAKQIPALEDMAVQMEERAILKPKVHAVDITKKVLDNFEVTEDTPEYHEIQKALNLAITKMLVFQSKGGKVDSKILQPTDKQVEIIKALHDKNEKVINAEKEIFRLENVKQILQLEENYNTEEE